MATGTLKRLSASEPPYVTRNKIFSRQRSATNKGSYQSCDQNEKRNDPEQEQPFCEEKICDQLGLDETLTKDFLDQLKFIPDNVRCHRSTEGWILIFIENSYNEIKEESVKQNLNEELLKQLGFSNSEVMKKIISRSKLMQHHLDPIDSVKRYVRDEFKYNSNLAKFMQENEARTLDSADEPLYFSDYRNDEYSEVNRLFHGTDIYSARNIQHYGIEIGFGMPKRDFSNGLGFYLTDSFQHAKTWALSQTSEPVVLEFRVQKSFLKKARRLGLDLSPEEKWSTWYQIVTEHRSGTPSISVCERLRGYKYLKGPMSVPRCSGSEILREPNSSLYQMCIVNEDFADEIGKHAKYILYTKSPE